MSYSHSFRAASIAALCAIAASKMAETVQTQPFHEVDRDAALKNVKEHAEVIGEPPEAYEFAVSMHGSGWAEAGGVVRSVGSGCTVTHDRIPASQAAQT
jgi:hypothetical protein